MNYQRLIGPNPSYWWFNDHLRRNPSQSCGVSSYSDPKIGLRFQSLYLTSGLIIAQGPNIVHTILVAGDSELRAATYIKIGTSEVIIVGLDKNVLHKLIPEVFSIEANRLISFSA